MPTRSVFRKTLITRRKMLRGYTKEAKAANDSTGDFDQKLKVAGASIRGLGAATLQVTGLVVAGVGAMVAASTYMVRQSAQQAREIERMATVAQVSVERIQALAYASEQYSISGEKMSDILKDVNDKLGDYAATGGGEFKDFFEQVAPKVGLTVEKLQQMAGPEALVAVKDAMDQANVPMKQQIFYLESIANDASALMPLLENKGAKLYELTERYKDLNVVMSKYDIQQFKQMDQQISEMEAKLSRAFGNLSRQVMFSLLPSMESVNTFVDDLAKGVKNYTNQIEAFGLASATANVLTGTTMREKHREIFGEMVELQEKLREYDNEDPNNLPSINPFGKSRNELFNLQASLSLKRKELQDLNDIVVEQQKRLSALFEYPEKDGSAGGDGGQPGDGGGGSTDSKELERQQAAGATRLSSLDMQYANEREKLQLAHQQRLADIEALQVSEKELKQRGYETLDALKADYASREKGFYQAELQERQRNQDDAIQREIDAFARKEEEKTRLAEQEAKQRAYMEERLMQERIRGVSNFMGQISQLQNSENKNAARIGKTAARFQIMLNAYESATSAYKSLVGIPYVGPGLAAAAAGTAMGFGISMASKVDSLSNMAHNGITEVPMMGGKRESNWTLLAGERVYTNESANQIDQMFNAIMLMQSRVFAFNDPISQTSKESSRMAPRTMVNIYGAPEGARTEEKTGENGEEIINVFLADIDTDGQMSQAMTRTFGLARQGV